MGQKSYHINHAYIHIKDSATDLGITVDSKVKFHERVADIVYKGRGVALNILKATLNREFTFMIPLFTSHVHPILEYVFISVEPQLC